jgi:quercetin dioxygenase-like cupin family protein
VVVVLGAAAALAANGPEEGREMVVANANNLTYTAIPDMPACATGAIVRGNPRSGPAWVMLKLASGCRVPWHWHTANEDMVAISGQGTIDTKDGKPLRIAPGAYASLPAHHVHRANCSRTCVFFSIADAAYDIHYVDANGEEIKATKALAPAPAPAKAKAKPKPKSKKK